MTNSNEPADIEPAIPEPPENPDAAFAIFPDNSVYAGKMVWVLRDYAAGIDFPFTKYSFAFIGIDWRRNGGHLEGYSTSAGVFTPTGPVEYHS